MHIRRLLEIAVGVSAAVAMLGAYCTAGQQSRTVPAQAQLVRSIAFQATPTSAFPLLIENVSRPQAADPMFRSSQGAASITGGLYVGEPISHLVREFALPHRRSFPPTCADSYATRPSARGIAVNAQHILYVPIGSSNYGAFPINTYLPNCSGRGPTLYESFGAPSDVAFDNKNGKVYVSFEPNFGSGGISVFDRGQTYPTRTLLLGPNSVIQDPIAVGVNSRGDVFLSGGAGTGIYGSFVEFPGGRQKGMQTLSPPGLVYPADLEFDRNDNLIVANGFGRPITVYAPPYTGAPMLTIPMNGSIYFCKLDQANRTLYVSNYTNNSVDVFAYPSGAFEYSIMIKLGLYGFIDGIAVDPPSN